VKETLEKAGIHFLYLPPYSPDLNPIEMLWSKIKAILRSLEIRTAEELPNAIASAFHAVTTSDCLGWFSAAGLCS
ncbi:MAG: transposase, partial [Clostridia bacterium]|nr:transposase [Clostridia bacterium]